MVEAPFIWGKKGQKLTPEQVERLRQQAAAAGQRGADFSPVGHWTQGAARVVDALGGVLKDRRADKAEELGMAAADEWVQSNPVVSGLLGTPAPMPAVDPMSGGMAGQPSPAMYDTGRAPVVAGDADATEALGRAPMGAGSGGQFDLAGGIIETARAIGADPLDLATAISYETAGTFDPTKRGPTTQWGQHRGLIQFGEPQAQQYGVDWNDPLGSQLGPDGAIAKYFRSSGFKPGMSGLDLYSTINAGAPGRYKASDADNGGAPGDVADKWNNQMAGHREKAMALLGGQYTPQARGSYAPQPQQDSGVLAALAAGMSNPWVAKKYGPVIQALMGNEMSRQNMAYQQQLKQQDPMYQAQLAQITAPQQPKPIEVGGVLLDPSTYEPIFDSRQQEGGGGFTLSPGQQRFDANGNPIASGAPVEAPRPMTPEERQQWGIPPEDARPYAMTPEGPKLIGGSGVTVNNNMGEDKFGEAFAKGDAAALGTISESGIAAQRNLGRIDQLAELLAASPSGFVAAAKQRAGEWGINTDGLSDIQAAQALINSLVPEQRQPGSGPMSDADLELFKQSLPRIINQPGGNERIVQTMRAIAEYDAEGARIVQDLRAGKIDRAQAFAALQSRENPLANIGAAAPQPAPGLATPAPQAAPAGWNGPTPDQVRQMDAMQISAMLSAYPDLSVIPEEVLMVIIEKGGQ